MKIVVDMMGGDNGSVATIEAVKNFLKLHDDVTIYAVGDKSVLEGLKDVKNVIYLESQSVLPMDVDPMVAYRTNDSSLMVCIEAFLANGCDAIISAGSSGALLTASVFKIKRLANISRPAFITSFPTIKDKKFVVCDLGASNFNTKEELVQFAKMGSLYYKFLYGKENPEVYLLSNGTEDEKGSPLTKDAYLLLKDDTSLNFRGNCEARSPLFGDVDVLVTDGFTGNVFLKATEGCAKAMSQMIKDAFKRNIFSKIGYLLTKKGITNMKNKMDYKNVGGSMLVGVNGVVIKAHGDSDKVSFLSGLEVAYKLSSIKIVDKFKEAL